MSEADTDADSRKGETVAVDEDATPPGAIVAADTLATFIEPVEAMVEEAKLDWTADGFHVAAVDPANVGMVDATLGEAGFEAFDATDLTIGISVERFADVLGLADSGDLVHLRYDTATRKLHIEAAGLEYTLAAIDPDTIRKRPELPDLELTADLRLTGAQLDRGATAADLVSDHVRIQADVGDDGTGWAQIVANGDTDDVELTLEGDELGEGTQIDARADSLFSLNYVEDILGPVDGDTECRLRVGEEMPLDLRYRLADDTVGVRNMVAPRIQSE